VGQVLHGSATTTEAVRRAVPHGQASPRALAKRYGINPKTVAKWRARSSVADRRTGPKSPPSTVLSREDEAVVVAFRRQTLPPPDDRLYAPQATSSISPSAAKPISSRRKVASEPFASGSRRAVSSVVILVGPGLGVGCQQPKPATNHCGDRLKPGDHILHHAQGPDLWGRRLPGYAPSLGSGSAARTWATRRARVGSVFALARPGREAAPRRRGRRRPREAAVGGAGGAGSR